MFQCLTKQFFVGVIASLIIAITTSEISQGISSEFKVYIYTSSPIYNYLCFWTVEAIILHSSSKTSTMTSNITKPSDGSKRGYPPDMILDKDNSDYIS